MVATKWCATIYRYVTDYMIVYVLIQHRKLIKLVNLYSKFSSGLYYPHMSLKVNKKTGNTFEFET